jgi:hypothetical protein
MLSFPWTTRWLPAPDEHGMGIRISSKSLTPSACFMWSSAKNRAVLLIYAFSFLRVYSICIEQLLGRTQEERVFFKRR